VLISSWPRAGSLDYPVAIDATLVTSARATVESRSIGADRFSSALGSSHPVARTSLAVERSVGDVPPRMDDRTNEIRVHQGRVASIPSTLSHDPIASSSVPVAHFNTKSRRDGAREGPIRAENSCNDILDRDNDATRRSVSRTTVASYETLCSTAERLQRTSRRVSGSASVGARRRPYGGCTGIARDIEAREKRERTGRMRGVIRKIEEGER